MIQSPNLLRQQPTAALPRLLSLVTQLFFIAVKAMAPEVH